MREIAEQESEKKKKLVWVMETCFCLRNLGGRKIGGGISMTSGSMKSEYVFPEINRFLFGDRESEGKCEKNVSTRIKIVSVSERERERVFKSE